MYELKIKTKYNEINIVVEDYKDEEVQEILSQPYIVEVEMHKIKEKEVEKGKVLKKCKKAI